METENIVNVVPTKQQLLTTKGRVSCTEDGCTKSFAHSGALRMHTVKSHGLIKVRSFVSYLSNSVYLEFRWSSMRGPVYDLMIKD
jgi:hypothetical protein